MKASNGLCGVAVALALAVGGGPAVAADTLLFAAGSLKAALGEVVASHDAKYGTSTGTRFGPSGLLRGAIEEGEQPDVFASANMAHPNKLAGDGWGSPVALFARNQLCGLAQPGLTVTSNNLLDVLLDTGVRVGTSTPVADPSGDYAWGLFKRAETLRPGSFAMLDAKALQLTGGPDSAPLAVGADYGLIVRADAGTKGWRLALFILSPEGQAILASHGFEADAVPR
ncbi:MAG: substrate-binding domain-containing protein [Gammaproteobacteria bacterium]